MLVLELVWLEADYSTRLVSMFWATVMEQPFQNSVALMGLAVYHILSQRPPFRYEPERRQDAVKKDVRQLCEDRPSLAVKRVMKR